jgi:hypothetical protein
MREHVFASAYVISKTALVNGVDTTENQVDAWKATVRFGSRRYGDGYLGVFDHAGVRHRDIRRNGD